MINAIGTPLKFLGMFAYSNLSLIPAKSNNASEKPTATPKPFTIVSIKLYPSWIFIIATPRTAQFVVINGKNTPSALYRLGDVFLIDIYKQ